MVGQIFYVQIDLGSRTIWGSMEDGLVKTDQVFVEMLFQHINLWKYDDMGPFLVIAFDPILLDNGPLCAVHYCS